MNQYYLLYEIVHDSTFDPFFIELERKFLKRRIKSTNVKIEESWIYNNPFSKSHLPQTYWYR